MSRTTKKAIWKEGNGKHRKCIRRKIKRSQKHFLRSNLFKIIDGNAVIPDPKAIVNQYEYSDYKIDYEYASNPFWHKNEESDKFIEQKKKLSRK